MRRIEGAIEVMEGPGFLAVDANARFSQKPRSLMDMKWNPWYFSGMRNLDPEDFWDILSWPKITLAPLPGKISFQAWFAEPVKARRTETRS